MRSVNEDTNTKVENLTVGGPNEESEVKYTRDFPIPVSRV
jgi:hypothetical protein